MNNLNLNSKLFKKIINIISIMIIFYISLVAIYSIYKIFFTSGENFIFYLLYFFLSITFLFLLIYFYHNTKILSLFTYTFILLITSLYSYEIYLINTPNTIWEKYEQELDKGTQIVPHFRKRYFSKDNENSYSNEIYVLGGVSKKNLVMTNENGYYPVNNHDIYGWNNINYNYNEFDIALIGGSFVEGYAVKQEQNISSLMRKAGLKTVSFGMSQNGPYRMYAVFREYVSYFKPKTVIWFYTEENIYELNNSLNDKFLDKYLSDDKFSQNLINRQREIDIVMSKYSNEKWEEMKPSRVREYINEQHSRNIIFRTLKLTETREKFKFHKKIVKKTPDKKIVLENLLLDNQVFSKYKEIIQNVKKEIENWNGKLYFVYIPNKEVFMSSANDDERLNFGLKKENKNKIFDIIKEENIDILNLEDKIREEYDEHLDLYSGHLNKKGYEFLARKIISFLDK